MQARRSGRSWLPPLGVTRPAGCPLWASPGLLPASKQTCAEFPTRPGSPAGLPGMGAGSQVGGSTTPTERARGALLLPLLLLPQPTLHTRTCAASALHSSHEQGTSTPDARHSARWGLKAGTGARSIPVEVLRCCCCGAASVGPAKPSNTCTPYKARSRVGQQAVAGLQARALRVRPHRASLHSLLLRPRISCSLLPAEDMVRWLRCGRKRRREFCLVGGEKTLDLKSLALGSASVAHSLPAVQATPATGRRWQHKDTALRL